MSTSAMEPVGNRAPMVVDIIYGRLHQAITERRLEPGSLLTEQGLADQFDVSKTPVREALARLRHVGLIEPEGRRGLRVVKLSPEGLRQSFEIRIALETYVAARAAECADSESRALISASAKASLEKALEGDIPGFHQFDSEFHAQIARLIDNPRIIQQIDNAVAQIHTIIRSDIFPDMEEMVRCARAHVRIADAISIGAADTAAREMTAHVHKIYDLILISAGDSIGH